MVLNRKRLTVGVREMLVEVQQCDGVHPEVRRWLPEEEPRSAVEVGRNVTALVFGEGSYPQSPTPDQLASKALQ